MVGVAGLLFQIILGFTLANNHELFSTLILPHIVIGVGGIALAGYLAWRSFMGSSRGVKLLYGMTFVLVLAQVALGFEVLTVGTYLLVMSHEAVAFTILVFLAASEAFALRQVRKVPA